MKLAIMQRGMRQCTSACIRALQSVWRAAARDRARHSVTTHTRTQETRLVHEGGLHRERRQRRPEVMGNVVQSNVEAAGCGHETYPTARLSRGPPWRRPCPLKIRTPSLCRTMLPSRRVAGKCSKLSLLSQCPHTVSRKSTKRWSTTTCTRGTRPWTPQPNSGHADDGTRVPTLLLSGVRRGLGVVVG